MAEPRLLELPVRSGDRLDDALARMAGRLAVALDVVGEDAGARFLRGLPGAGAPGPADGGCLDLPSGPTQPVDRLVAGLALGTAERDLLALVLVGSHHEGVAAVLRGLHPQGRPWPTVGLAGSLAELGGLPGAPSRAAVRPALAGLLATGTVVVQDDDAPYPERTLRPAPHLFDALTGLAGWPSGVEPDPRPLPAAGSGGWLGDEVVGGARRAVERGLPVSVVLAGARPGPLAGRLATLAATAGREPVLLRVDRCDSTTVSAVLLLALVRGTVPVLWTDVEPPRLRLTVPGLPVPLLLAAPGTGLCTWPRPVLVLPSGPHPPADRSAALDAALPELGRPPGPLGPATLEPGDVELAAADVRLRAALVRTATGWDEVSARVDAQAVDTVPVGATLVHPRAGWGDLVIPADRLTQLHEAADRVRVQSQVLDDWGLLRGRRGLRGLRMLFAGPPGTGKTLAAEVLAGELGRDLLVVDLSQLVSKWIGETEKNLAAVFDAAERGGSALLFDEADALFGKRTEVGDARDRYANLETAYLLARLERFDGIAVLATNLRQNLDTAFARRIEFVVPFDPPDEAARLALWRAHLSGGAPLAPDVDLPLLAAVYELPGALIRNAALAAAFLAAAEPAPEDRRIGMAHLAHAVRREHLKAGLSYPGPPPGTPADPPTRRGAP
ncbi:ATPase family associated with various cellular activities (AAA) [Geodermatophilus dictyosporus]|uniref:ATPase family associated with various cellular activities (AAA) n=1 Tax=Geodermatophilus dictyosporus TaxID=1523247 RepID=A0A1I5JQ30_9ACTN|nr:ATP-binding protein [Geodermatophilus dictyosporus]SFO74829.1 ATPase family associated with various cellular activities (AAA) [Geodermatophilus dictyosporus]